MGHSETAWEAFERDVPEGQRESVLEMLSEAAHGSKHKYGSITIHERDRANAINVRVQGSILIGGVEHTFILRDGDMDGTELESWDEDDTFEYARPVELALCPRDDLVGDALASGRGDLLLQKWDALISREPYASLIRKYSYDRYFQPGGKIEGHYRDQASAGGFVIVTKEEADATRAKLTEHRS